MAPGPESVEVSVSVSVWGRFNVRVMVGFRLMIMVRVEGRVVYAAATTLHIELTAWLQCLIGLR